MVFCNITQEGYKSLYKVVVKKMLLDQSPKDVIKSVFDILHEGNPENIGTAVSFVKETPKMMGLAMKYDPGINDIYNDIKPEIDALNSSFSTYNDVIKYLVDNQILEKSPQDQMKEIVDNLINEGKVPELFIDLARTNPEQFLREISQQINNIVGGQYNTEFNAAEQAQFNNDLKDAANKFFPEYKELADRALGDQAAINAQKIKLDGASELSEAEPEIEEERISFRSIFGKDPKVNTNIVSEFVDEARRRGIYMFPSNNVKEVEMEGNSPKEEDGAIVLKSTSDKSLYRHRKVIEHLISKYERDNDFLKTLKVKIEPITDSNKTWFYKDEKKSSFLIATLIDESGKYLYFDKNGNPASIDTGEPFAVEYEDEFYNTNNLSISRNSIGGDGQFIPSIKPGFATTNPLSTIFSLLKAGKPVYGSIPMILPGPISSYRVSNSYASNKKSSYKMRSLKELFDSGELSKQLIDIKINGFWIASPRGIWESEYYVSSDTIQNVKIGRPYIYDIESEKYIALTGNKLRNITFAGNKIPENSRLYEIIDVLDKKGEININTPRSDGKRIVESTKDLIQVYSFLKHVLYSKMFSVSFDGYSLRLRRNEGTDFNYNTIKANSIWDAELNYVKGAQGFINLPLGYVTEEDGSITENMIYQDFLEENFFSGVAKAKISEKEKKITKINSRLVIKLDKSEKEMISDLEKIIPVKLEDPRLLESVSIGDRFSPNSNLEEEYEVVDVADGIAFLTSDKLKEKNEEIKIKVKILLSPNVWTPIRKEVKKKTVSLTEAQTIAIQNVKRLNSINLPFRKYRVTQLASPYSEKSTQDDKISAPIIVGNAIDHIAKKIFSNIQVNFGEEFKSTNSSTSTLSAVFKSELHFKEVVSTITKIKNSLEDEGYAFVTGIRISDPETLLSGETDLLLIDKEGIVTVADFKSSSSIFNDYYFSTVNNRTSNKEYFSTQGALYRMLLAKNNIKVSDEIKILGISVSYSFDSSNPLETTKIEIVRESDKYVFPFSISQMNPLYKGLSSIEDIIRVYESVQTDDMGTPKSFKFKGRDLGPLEMSIVDINQISASDEILKKQIDEMQQMLGEKFVVRWVNSFNSKRYGFWDVQGMTLYKNAVDGTPYHEGWHHFSQLFLTIPQKVNLYNSIREGAHEFVWRDGKIRNTKDLSYRQIEEMLADEWVKYVKNPSSYKFPISTKEEKGIIAFFKKMFKFIKRWFTGETTPSELFKRLYNGQIREYRAQRSINNAMWGNLNSSIIGDQGNEILNAARTQIYVNRAAGYIFQALHENNLSLSWLRANQKSEKVANMVKFGFTDKLEERLSKIMVPSSVKDEDKIQYILDNEEDVISLNTSSNGFTKPMIQKYIQQIEEISNILNEEDGSFHTFLNYFFKNPPLESLRDENEVAVNDLIDPEITSFFSEDEDFFAEYEGEDDELKGADSSGQQFNEGPNDKSAYTKASQEIKDFFSTQPIVTGKNPDGTWKFKLDEFDEPEIHSFSSLFSKVKYFLANKNTIEEVEQTLANPLLQKDYPQIGYVLESLQKYKDNPSVHNFTFVQRFLQVMSMPEVDNQEVYINLDAVSVDTSFESTWAGTVVRMNSISRIGERKQYQHWEASFKIPREKRPGTIVSQNEKVTSKYIFTSNDKDNIIYNVAGSIYLNPFYDYSQIREQMGTKEFLELIGINLSDRFWENPDSVLFAERFASLFIKNVMAYKMPAASNISNKFEISPENFSKMMSEDLRNVKDLESLIRNGFISNPLNLFRLGRRHRVGERVFETISMLKVGEDLARANNIFSMNVTSNSFITGDGKTKWSSYEKSMIAYRTHMLNKVINSQEFNIDPIEYSFINPETLPWMRKSLFFKTMFDENGERIRVRSSLREESENRIKIEVVDLSSLTTLQDGVYKTVHPKQLNAQGKLFFDIVTMMTSGFVESPRAATSSTLMAVKLNSYGGVVQGQGYKSEIIPLDYSSVTTSVIGSNFTVNLSERANNIFLDYLSAELQKMKWYYDQNPSNKYASILNVFGGILNSTLKQELISAVQNIKSKELEKIATEVDNIIRNKDMKQFIILDLKRYLSEQTNLLYNGKNNSSLMKMSTAEKRVLKNLTNLYENAQQVTTAADVQREEKIASNVAARGQESSFQKSREKVARGYDTTLGNIGALFLVNQLILNIEYHMLYVGDNYLFSNPFKRYNLATNTGIMGIISPYTNSMLNRHRGETLSSIITGKPNGVKDFRKTKSYVAKDVIVKSKSLDIIINDLIDYENSNGLFSSETNEQKAERLLNMLAPLGKDGQRGGYNAINAADGQSKISLDAYRTFRIVFGSWDFNKDEKEYRRQLAITKLYLEKQRGDVYISEEEKKKDEAFVKEGPYSEFNPQKWSYTGPELMLDDNGNPKDAPMRTLFDKTSLHPILPEVVFSGEDTQDMKLLFEMAINDADYIKFESSAKGVKHGNIFEMFNVEGSELDYKLESVDPQYIISSYVKRQLTTDGKTKRENTFGSQQRVEIFDIKYLPEILNNKAEFDKISNIENRYLDAVENIQLYHKAILLNKYGLVEVSKGGRVTLEIENYDRFAAGVNQVAKSNNFPANMREYLKYDPAKKEYEYDPSLVFNRKVLIDAIGGEIDKELRMFKVKGSSAIQVTSIGTTRHPYSNPTIDQIKQFGTGGLHFYHYIRDKNGKIEKVSTMGVKLTLQGDFENLLNLSYEGKKIETLERLNIAIKDKKFKELHFEKLTFVGYRIPTNNNNFIDRCEIMEFLPKSTGNIIISPPEHIIKTGSDFDVDKMNFIFPSIDSKGELTSLPYENILISEATYDNKGNKKSDAVYKKVILTIEDLHKRMNQITNSARDYKENQRFIKEAIGKGKIGLKNIEKRVRAIQANLEQKFFEVDHIVLLGMKREKTFFEIIEYFKDFFIDDESVMSDINLYYKGLDILNDNNLSDVVSKVDDEFFKILSDLAKYKDYYTNKMLSAAKEILQHPGYLKLLVTPSTTDYLVSEATRIGDLVGRKISDNLSATENSSSIITNTKFGEYLGDYRGALGAYAIQRKWYSLLNYSEMEINRSWRYSNKHPMRIFMPLVEKQKRDSIGNERTVKLYGDNIDGISPRDIWDQFMSLTIDLPSNSSYTLFGINKFNQKIVQYLIASRYSISMIMNFINQPILQEVYARMTGNSSIFGFVYEANPKDLKNYTLKHALLEVAEKLGMTTTPNRDGESLQSLYQGAFKRNDIDGIIEAADEFVKHPGLFSNNFISDETEFSKTQLEADIQNIENRDSEYLNRQKTVLAYFMEVALESSNFSALQFAYNEDRSKNTNYYTITEALDYKRIQRGNLNDFDEPEGTMFSKASLVKLEKRSIFSIFNYSNIAKLIYKEFAKKFTEVDVEMSIMKLLKMSNSFGIDRQFLATRIESDYIEFIYKNFGEFNINIYNPITDTLSKSEKRFSEHFMQEIYNVNKDINFRGYGSKLIALLEKYPELASIEFVKALTPQAIVRSESEDLKNPNPMDSYDAEVLRFARSAENTVVERNLYSFQFENLIKFQPSEFKISKNYTTEDVMKISSFFTELAYLTLYQSGPTNIADNFSDLVPTSIWQPFSHNAFKNLERSINEGKIRKIDMMKMFSMMFIENNKRVPWKNKTLIYNLTYFQRENTKADESAIRSYRKYIAYFNNYTAGKMYDMQVFTKRIGFLGLKDLYC